MIIKESLLKKIIQEEVGKIVTENNLQGALMSELQKGSVDLDFSLDDNSSATFTMNGVGIYGEGTISFYANMIKGDPGTYDTPPSPDELECSDIQVESIEINLENPDGEDSSAYFNRTQINPNIVKYLADSFYDWIIENGEYDRWENDYFDEDDYMDRRRGL